MPARDWQPPGGPIRPCAAHSGAGSGAGSGGDGPPPDEHPLRLRRSVKQEVGSDPLCRRLVAYLSGPAWGEFWSRWYADCAAEWAAAAPGTEQPGSEGEFSLRQQELYRRFLSVFEGRLGVFCMEQGCTEVELLAAARRVQGSGSEVERLFRVVLDQSDWSSFAALMRSRVALTLQGQGGPPAAGGEVYSDAEWSDTGD
eukprot:TRINITY_DN44921_c0_g1_i1.p1 TRINITY_DN44921_c0_g1~~TRINITY_DN44921_c0_g1_i1.p1  ORF type:complete len:222 (+),score=63.31 TRINITY_DN44921_c0_g1_i1:72-668(+)